MITWSPPWDPVHPADVEVAAMAQLSKERLQDGPDAESGRKTGAPGSTQITQITRKMGLRTFPSCTCFWVGTIAWTRSFSPIFRFPRCIESESGVASPPC